MALVGFRHVGLKVMSIVLAALLWLVVSGEQIVERTLRIPLEFANLPTQLELVGYPPNVVDVRVRGSSGALSRVPTGELVAVVDLRSAREGPRLFPLASADVRAPFGVEVIQVTPSTVSMTFERSATKVVPVVPEVEGEPAAGFEVGTVTAEPASVEVTGPTSALAGLTAAITETVSVAGASAQVTEMVNAGVTDPAVRLTTPDPVRVTVNVAPAKLQWAVRNVPVSIVGGATDTSAAPTAVTVHLRGSRDAMRTGPAGITASVDATALTSGRYTLPVRVVLPPGVGMTRVEPAEVQVRIR
jgi:YbbR domain-containing protein